jgi:hypothetical protein
MFSGVWLICDPGKSVLVDESDKFGKEERIDVKYPGFADWFAVSLLSFG